MSTVSSQNRSSTVVFAFSDIDAMAEREALAIERLEELTGRPTLNRRHNPYAFTGHDTYVSGLPGRTRLPSYRWTASVKAHARISKDWHFQVWGPEQECKKMPSENNVVRRLATLVRRQEKLAMLSAMRNRYVSLEEGAKLTSIGVRTLQRHCVNGTLPARKDFTPTPKNGLGKTGRWQVRISDLRTWAKRKLNKLTIAA